MPLRRGRAEEDTSSNREVHSAQCTVHSAHSPSSPHTDGRIQKSKSRKGKNPKRQKIKVTTVVETLTATKNFSLLKCPINMVSVIPTNGIAKLEKNIGIASLKI